MKGMMTRSRRTVLETGKYLKVELHTVELPDGTQIPDWPWVITPDFALVAAVTPQGRFLCFRQTKYSIEGLSLALPGGYLDAGEDPLPAAQRELLEETGYVAPEWEHLGSFPVDGNRGVGIAHLYLALGATPVAERDADDLEAQELLLLSEAEIAGALDAGEFRVLPWAAAVALALLRLDQQAPRTAN
jgi:ADP-ribose pyrophosphatase